MLGRFLVVYSRRIRALGIGPEPPATACSLPISRPDLAITLAALESRILAAALGTVRSRLIQDNVTSLEALEEDSTEWDGGC